MACMRVQISAPQIAKLAEWKQAAIDGRLSLRINGRRIIGCRNFACFGPRDLYRGFTSSLLGTMPTAMTYFFVYERARFVGRAVKRVYIWPSCASALTVCFLPCFLQRRRWAQYAQADTVMLERTACAANAGIKPWVAKRSGPDWISHMAAAAGSAVVSALPRVPGDTIRHRVQAYLHPNSFRAVPQLLKAKGLPGFYSGFRPTLMRDVPEIAIQFAAYECLRSAVQGRNQGKKLATWQHLLLGGLSGALAACTTMPIDVLKTQMQCSSGAQAGSLRIACKAMQHTLAEKGPTALFTGLVCVLLFAVSHAALQ